MFQKYLIAWGSSSSPAALCN